MKALVTGAGGFLGLYVVEQLVARGDQVRAMCRGNDSQLESIGAEIVRADLRNRDAVVRACQTVDVVFHVGGVAGMNGPWRPYYETNVLGTDHVLEGCRRHGVGRLVYTSSPSVTFDGRDQNGIDESMPYPKRWLCHYARSKGLAEQQVLAANGRDGLLTCALRPHLIWGPRDRHLLPTILTLARTGQIRQVGDGSNRVDTSYVENVATAHLQAADALRPGSPVAGRAYFISQGDPVNCWQWINQVLAMAGLPPIQKTISRRAAWWLGAACETLYWLLRRKDEPPMSRFLAAELSASHFFDIRHARQDFGYEPTISTAEGLQRLAASWTATS